MDLYTLAAFVVLGGLVVFLSAALFARRWDRFTEVRDTMLAPDELERHAIEIARSLPVGKSVKSLHWLVRRMNDNFELITSVYRALNTDVKYMFPTAPASEWLLDNFYIIEEQVKLIRKNLSKGQYSRLPVLTRGYLKGYPRVYAIALEIIAHSDGRIDEKTLFSFINAYQSESLMSMAELWALALMLRIALVENLRYICESIDGSRRDWHAAEKLAAAIAARKGDEGAIADLLNGQLDSMRVITPSFAEHLLQRLRKSGSGVSTVTHLLDLKLGEKNSSTDAITALEHQIQASLQVSTGNTVTGLRLVSEIDWSDIFESLSSVEKILRKDPCGIYPLMDFESRDYYRHEVEKLARAYGTSEINIASKAVECCWAAAGENPGSPLGHVGYYLVGKGGNCLTEKLGGRSGGRRLLYFFKEHPMVLYISLIVLITGFLTCFFSYYVSSRAPNAVFYPILAAIVVLVPCSELAIAFVNTVLSHIFRPTTLPKLELRGGVPEELSTMVIIPTLIPNGKRACELIDQLEVFHLANREKNLFFALVADFKDSALEKAEGDEVTVGTALEGIRRLNAKYAPQGMDIFFYFHRKREFNPAEGRWMGRERKRGAIVEFNRLLRGSADTGFTVVSGDLSKLPRIKYVITLDADTSLPMDSARKLIGTMAHPLNRAVVDREAGIVREGYGLLQPRISVSIPGANRSLFTRIFAGQGGVDPYTTAVSDIYQDIFGEGIFTGKGIYEVDVFREVLEARIPDNSVLSHDLIEGCHLRAGLVTDIELVDGYPSRYNSFTMRQHRWVRGDWQLLPWLSAEVSDSSGAKKPNRITALSKWKIIDNLRRSLLYPFLFITLCLGMGVLPGSPYVWAGLSAAAASTPVLTGILNIMLAGGVKTGGPGRNSTAIGGFRAPVYQSLLLFIFIPFQAYLMSDAILRTLARVFITRRNLLEWVTAADAEAGAGNDPAGSWRRMWFQVPAAVLVLALSALSGTAALPAAAVIALCWLAAPHMAYAISRPYVRKAEQLRPQDAQMLRRLAAKTWRYFEDFATKEDHYLPPDNFQEDPPRGSAHRTSPTNIGLLLMSVLSAGDLGFFGIGEMAARLDKVISTIERMEKWKGHLYNWYNTITLNTMRPLYVSTVDSGNFVGYLMVLREGLREYACRPVPSFGAGAGLADLLGLLSEEGIDTASAMAGSGLDGIAADGAADPAAWKNTLTGLQKWSERPEIAEALRKSDWGGKFLTRLESCTEELRELYPLLDAGPEAKKILDEAEAGLYGRLTAPASLGALRETCERACELIAGRDDADILTGSLQGARDRLKAMIELYKSLIDRVGGLIDTTEFTPLFNRKRQLFSIGFNVEDGHLSKSYYDLLASEARQASYIAVARGEVERRHWSRLGRKLTSVDGFKGLVSWTGTMFEYFMPLLIMKNFENTIFDTTYSFVVAAQKKYARQRKIPWGVSESGYHAFDINLNYQYKAFGVPELGLKRGLGNDMVVAPYASILALCVDPASVVSNLRELAGKGMDGLYGMYEAIDFTPSRLGRSGEFNIVRSYMAHHQGMSLTALNNFFNPGIMQQRFHANPVIKSAELLLQERSPEKAIFSKEYRDESSPAPRRPEQDNGEVVRTCGIPRTVPPVAHILSNGSYSVMVTDGGAGYSKCEGIAVSRWTGGTGSGNGGMFLYIQNVNSNTAWSATFEPVKSLPERYRVVFSPDKAEYSRKDGNIETTTEIAVSPEDNAEIRRVSLTNHSSHSRTVEVTSYFEAVLSPPEEDASHPAFSKLFVRTEFIREHECLLASRRHRKSGVKPLWLMHAIAFEGEAVGDIQYETDRLKFIGRNRDLSNPAAMEADQPLSNSEGSVIDPVMCLRRRVRMEPGQTVRISYSAAVAETRKHALELAEKYHDYKMTERVFELSWTRSQVEARYLGLNSEDVEKYLEIVPFLLFNNPMRRSFGDHIRNNVRAQKDLWPFGISGDIPIVLLVVKDRDDASMVEWVLKGHEYWRMKGLEVDLLIYIDREEGYSQPVYDMVRDAVSASHARELVNRRGGIFVKSRAADGEDLTVFFHAVAQLVVKDSVEALKTQLKQLLDTGEPKPAYTPPAGQDQPLLCRSETCEELEFYNGLGGFRDGGREYVIKLSTGQYTPAPWVNVIANEGFGFLVTESGGGYTWAENSRENKLTPWYNDPVTDRQGEILYVRDMDAGDCWSLTPMPAGSGEQYTVRHGFGYSVFENTARGMQQSLTMFAALEERVRIYLIRMKNLSGPARRLSLTLFAIPVLGVDERHTAPFIVTDADEGGGVLFAENTYNDEFRGRVFFMGASEKKCTWTGDRTGFTGVNGSLAWPCALLGDSLDCVTGAGLDPCAALQFRMDIGVGEEKDFVFVMGQAASRQEALELAGRFGPPEAAIRELDRVRSFWTDRLQTLQIRTPDESADIMLNGWLLYQTLACRIWARSAYYQSGGAFGFRDQLQDSMALLDTWPEITRRQILLHASRQFAEGDVQHWWHAETGKGIRTRYSDDLLWLPFATACYITHTGDTGILDETVPFLETEALEKDEDERYDAPACSTGASSLYDHCIRAVERSLSTGPRGIPLMGSGDWNDGMNTVGNKGLGESIWLGWFLYAILQDFIPLCTLRQDSARADRYLEYCEKIRAALENEGWDGSWYRRAYFDDGTPLGSIRNSECRIDSIAQSWSVISGAAKPSRREEAMAAVEKYLIDREEGIIKLLTPPFDTSPLEPGYIKGYVPGVRENGGQYTHAATWVILAFARLGDGEKAWELFHMINPVNHARTPIEYARYKVEPYVLAADVYSVAPNTGRGGWTWYTGAAGWLYRIGVEHMAGISRRGGYLSIDPCIPGGWSGYRATYRYGKSVYSIAVENPEKVGRGVAKIIADGLAVQGNMVKLLDDGLEHFVRVVLGKRD